jgi:hypothetical protein
VKNTNNNNKKPKHNANNYHSTHPHPSSSSSSLPQVLLRLLLLLSCLLTKVPTFNPCAKSRVEFYCLKTFWKKLVFFLCFGLINKF